MRITSSHIALAASIFWSVAVVVALASLGNRMRPVNQGTSDGFWSSAAFVSIRGGDQWGNIAIFEGDQAYYSPASMDGSWLYSIPRQEALLDWPLVIRAWDARAAAPNAEDYLVPEYLKWKALPPAQKTPESLMKRLNAGRDARLDRAYPRPPGQPSLNDVQMEWLKSEVAKSKLYWVNFVFEFVILSGCGWFALWPTIRNRSMLQNLGHISLTPFLFLLPAWLGYCPFVVNGVGPAGGVVYPWLLLPLRGVNFDFEWARELAVSMPQWLSSIVEYERIGRNENRGALSAGSP